MNNYQVVSLVELLHHRLRKHVIVINMPGALDVMLFELRFIAKIDKSVPFQLSGIMFADKAPGKIAIARTHEGM